MAGTLEELIFSLTEKGYLKTPHIIEAFRRVDRKDFVFPRMRSAAYLDEPLPIGYGQTISQPLTVAFMLERLGSRPRERVLDIGSGSGWTTALLASIVGSEGLVIGVERIPELVVFGKRNLARYRFPNAHILQAGERLGFPEDASMPRPRGGFDKILVSAAASAFPEHLLRELRAGGRIVVPVENAIWCVVKGKRGRLRRHIYPGFQFLPLVDS